MAESFMASTKPYTLEFKHAEAGGIVGKAGIILGRGRGLCPSCGYINTRPYEGYVPSCQKPGSCTNRQAVAC